MVINPCPMPWYTQVLPPAHHLLRRALGEEEEVLPQLRQHRHAGHPGHLHPVRHHRILPLRHQHASQLAHLHGESTAHTVRESGFSASTSSAALGGAVMQVPTGSSEVEGGDP